MNKLNLLCLNILILLFFSAYADNNLLNKSTSDNKALQVNYHIYNYEIPQTKFAELISSNKLDNGIKISNTLKEIYSIRVINNVEFGNLNKNLGNVFFEKSQGSDSCIINQDLCGGASSVDSGTIGYSKTSITFEPIMINNAVNVNMSCYYKPYHSKSNDNNNDIIKLSSFLSNAANKDYVVISRAIKGNNFYGQIILFSFSLIRPPSN